MFLLYGGLFCGLIIFVIGINHLVYYLGKGNRKLNMLLLPGVMVVVGVSLAIYCGGDIGKDINSKEELNSNIQDYLASYYKVNDADSITITHLSEEKYKIELLNGKKEVIKLDIKDREVMGIKIVDSSDELK